MKTIQEQAREVPLHMRPMCEATAELCRQLGLSGMDENIVVEMAIELVHHARIGAGMLRSAGLITGENEDRTIANAFAVALKAFSVACEIEKTK